MNSDRKSHRISLDESLRIKAQKENERNRKRWERMQASDWNSGFSRSEIDAQILEKKKKIEAEKIANLKYDEELCNHAAKMIEKEQEKSTAKRIKNITLANQRKQIDIQNSDTFDLNDPKYLQNDNPPRVGDDNIHVSSLQKFDGEDLNYEQRTKMQKDQSKKIFIEQAQEKQKVSKDEKIQDKIYAEHIIKMTEILNSKDAEKEKSRRNKNKMAQKENIELSIAEQEAKRLNKIKNEQINAGEIEYQKNSTFLTEDENATRRVDNPNRYISYNFKGFQPQVTEQFHEQRLNQAKECDERNKNEKLEEKRWADRMEMQRKTGLKMTMSNRRNKKQQLTSYRADLEEQIAMQKEAEKKRNELYKNEISQSFFDQFGTSHR